MRCIGHHLRRHQPRRDDSPSQDAADEQAPPRSRPDEHAERKKEGAEDEPQRELRGTNARYGERPIADGRNDARLAVPKPSDQASGNAAHQERARLGNRASSGPVHRSNDLRGGHRVGKRQRVVSQETLPEGKRERDPEQADGNAPREQHPARVTMAHHREGRERTEKAHGSRHGRRRRGNALGDVVLEHRIRRFTERVADSEPENRGGNGSVVAEAGLQPHIDITRCEHHSEQRARNDGANRELPIARFG